MTRADLDSVRAWADAKLASGEEPPWAWYQYMKLCEALDAILAGTAAARPQTANLPRAASLAGSGPRLVASTDPRDIARRVGTPVTLPM